MTEFQYEQTFTKTPSYKMTNLKKDWEKKADMT